MCFFSNSVDGDQESALLVFILVCVHDLESSINIQRKIVVRWSAV